METTLLIAATAVLVFLCRLSGFVLAPLASSPRLARFLRYVPIAVFSALLTSPLLNKPADLPSSLAALVAAALLLHKTRNIGLAIIAGLALFTLLTSPT